MIKTAVFIRFGHGFGCWLLPKLLLMKKTICLSSPAYLKATNSQLEIELPENTGQSAKKTTVPFEDIAVVVL